LTVDKIGYSIYKQLTSRKTLVVNFNARLTASKSLAEWGGTHRLPLTENVRRRENSIDRLPHSFPLTILTGSNHQYRVEILTTLTSEYFVRGAFGKQHEAPRPNSGGDGALELPGLVRTAS